MFKVKEPELPPVVKSKKKKKVSSSTVSLVDLTPVLNSFKELSGKVDQLLSSIPSSFSEVNSKLTEYKPKEVDDIEEDYATLEGFKNINSKLFEINDILVRFVATQKQINSILSNTTLENNTLLKGLEGHEEGSENKVLLQILELVKQVNQSIGNKEGTKEWNFEVIRDGNGNMQRIKATK